MNKLSKKIKRKGIRRLFLEGIIICGGLIFLLSATLFLWISFSSLSLPQPDVIGEKILSGSTQIYDRTGKILLYELGVRRFWVNYDEIPKKVILTTLAAEDTSFFYHNGVSIKGIIRALWLNIKNRSVGYGGSTITQQLARNLFLSQDKNIVRKIKEAILAIELEKKYSKDEIITYYLNIINFGEGNYGIKAASDFYFGKNIKDLTYAEIATLISIPRSPQYYSPSKKENIPRLISRKEQILKNLYKAGWINQKEYSEAIAEKLKFTEKKYLRIAAPHFVLEVKTILEKKFPKMNLEQAGLKVLTTLNYDFQKVAEESVGTGAKENEKKYKGKNAALLAMDPKTGEILAMVGSRDFNDTTIDGQVNMTIWPRQPGSAFKPFSYITLFQLGYPIETIIFDLPTNFGTAQTPYRPKNFSGNFSGPISLRSALARSLNIPAIKVFYLAGPERVIENARKFGITALDSYRHYGLSLGIGTAELRMIDMVRAYGVFANEGELPSQSLILKITDSNGKSLYEYQPIRERVIDTQSARMLNSILKDYEARRWLFGGTLGYTKIGNYDIAIKTGTSQDYRDAWALGYTPNLVVAVWSGNTNGSVMRGGESLVASLPIWGNFTKKVLFNFPIEPFNNPLPRTVNKPMLNGSYVSESGIHDILYFVDRNNPLGPSPYNPANDPQFYGWEGAVENWNMRNNEERGFSG